MFLGPVVDAMHWIDVFQRGARRVADYATYIIVLCIYLGATLPAAALIAATARQHGSGRWAFMILALIWEGLAAILAGAALTIAAVERPGLTRPSEVLGEALRHFATYLAITLLLVGSVAAAFALLVIVGSIGLGGTATAPILALLTPLFLIIGGVGLLALSATARLAFASAAVESHRAGPAVAHTWRLVRTHRADILLWLFGDGALLVGAVATVVAVIAIGATAATSIQAAFFSAGVGQGLSHLGGSARPGIAGAAIWLAIVGSFIALLVGAATSFQTGTAVGVYLRLRTTAQQDVRHRGAAGHGAEGDFTSFIVGFCDRCGSAAPAGARYCDACGAALAVA
jgi:hypothetical protein